ncbi:alanine dehydrogenase [Agaribacterium haliotis]|uniref:alanine dehydrogenase n=1 Tax=Agaribacterium haliotis TaxID=2013869 RepID=UPI000BB5452E|nr:alanine dehydrogenase [Agaribacterium haliotis]
MKIGVPKEVKAQEYRVALTPAVVKELCQQGHELFIEKNAGSAIGYDDELYRQAGATIVEQAAELWASVQLLVKVKEPQPQEYAFLREDLILFAYLHLAAEPELSRALVDSKVTAIAFETVRDSFGKLPLLAPMSEIAGRMSIQAAAHCLEKSQGGSGLLLGGVPGVAPAKVVVIGGGVVGINAARMAMGLGADVYILDKSLERLRELDALYGPALKTLYASEQNVLELLPSADVVVGAVLIPGAAAPKLLSRAMLAELASGSVLVDVAIDQGGCFETSRATTHAEPTYVIDGVVHYCVANIPGAVARTSSQALTNALFPYVRHLADSALKALEADNNFAEGLSAHKGSLISGDFAELFELPALPLQQLLKH